MELLLVRHAIAFARDPDQWPDDGERTLSPEGEARCRKAARGLKSVQPAVELVLSSPYARAWQTAEILAEEAGAIAKLLTSDAPNGALRASLDAGEESLRDAQAELHALPSNQFTESFFQLGEALREMLDQFRV